MADKKLAERYIKVKEKLFRRAYSFLNEQQQNAVFTANGPLLVLAGAGSGKTTVLVQRVAFLLKYGNAFYSSDTNNELLLEPYVKKLEEIADDINAKREDIAFALDTFACGKADPYSILAITFTNKAAKEMKERLEGILGDVADNIWAGTFHSVCAKILRMYIDRLGYSKSFTIYDTDDQKRLMTSCIKDLNVDDKVFTAKSVLSEISSSKDKLIDSNLYALNVSERDFRSKTVASLYSMYEAKKKNADALDFDDLIFLTVKLLKNESDIREKFNSKFKYILVDEYQDTNVAQFKLVELLCGEHNNIMVVGDDDQSIYKFRGATIENILGFDKHYRDTKVIKLEQNYRSKGNILNAANAVIKNNDGRKGKTLWTDNNPGEKITVRRCNDQLEEAQYIVNTIGKLTADGKYNFSDFAILYRMNSQSNALETVFAKSGYPYRILGGLRFYDRKEIKDIVAYLCVVANSKDNVRLKRIINVPKRGIGDTTVEELERLSSENNCSMLDIALNASSYPTLSRSAPRLASFAEMIAKISNASKIQSIAVIIEMVLSLTGYREMLSTGQDEDTERLENIKELVTNAIQYSESNEESTLEGFLEEVALISDIDNYDKNAAAVVMMTMHSSKGLEFPVVFLPGMEENIFPGAQSTFSQSELEEERRLCYVAITRAKDKLYMINCNSRMIFGRTSTNPRSRFIDEIPESLCSFEDSYMQREYNISNPPYKSYLASKSSDGVFVPSMGSKKKSEIPKAEVFRDGDQVEHPVFGPGLVIKATKLGNDMLYEVAFKTVGTKKVMGNYAKLKRHK